MHEVSKEKFKEMFFKYGKAEEGWGQGYWDRFYEKDEEPPQTYKISEPQSADQNKMMIVYDSKKREHRMFFMSEESVESFFDFPGKD